MTELETLKKRVKELEEFKELVSLFFRSIFSRVDNDCFYNSRNIQETILWALEHALKDVYYHEKREKVFKKE